MRRILLRRLALIPLILFLVSVLVFCLAEVVPGDIGSTILGPYATQEQVDSLKQELGYDRPLVVRYLDFAGGFVTGDWGSSYALDVPIRPLVAERAWNSILLGFYAFLLMAPIAIFAGVVAALREGRKTDRAITVGGLSLSATPEFVTGVILLIVFSVRLDWFPVTSSVDDASSVVDRLRAMTLPAISLALVSFGYVSRTTRAGTITALHSNYVRTAIIKGVPRARLLSRHVLRNSMLPTLTVLGTQLGYLLGGLVVAETLFNYPGMGKLLLDAATNHDVPLLEVTTLVSAVLYMSCILASDLLYGVVDPRVRHEAALA